MSVFDLIAKVMAVNCIQFNGKYGCLYCLDEGQNLGHRHLYFPEEEHQARTSRTMKLWAEQAESSGNIVNGVKGKSVLLSHISAS